MSPWRLRAPGRAQRCSRSFPAPVGSCAASARGGYEGQEFAIPHLLRHGRDEFENYPALPVHQVGLGRTIDAPFDGGAPIGIECHGLIWITELLQPLLGPLTLILPVESDDGHDVLLGNREQRL